MAVFANGRVPFTHLSLVQVGPVIRLNRETARAWRRMKKAYKKSHPGQAMTIYRYGGYRSYALQRAMRLAPHKYGVQSGISLAVEGNSTHGHGKCIDIFAGLDWARQNAYKFGFNHPNPADHAHFEFVGTRIARAS